MFSRVKEEARLEEILRKVELGTKGHSIIGAKFSLKEMKTVKKKNKRKTPPTAVFITLKLTQAKQHMGIQIRKH